MIVLLDDSVFALATPEARRRLVTLVENAKRMGHCVCHTDGDPLPAASAAHVVLVTGGGPAPLVDPDREWLREELRIGFELATMAGVSDRQIRVHARPSRWSQPNPGRAVLSLEDAAGFINQPVELHVEHGENDRRFYQCLVPASRRAELEGALARGSLAFRNGGGKDGVATAITGAAERSDQSFIHRALAIIDSDSAERGKTSKGSNRCRRACRKVLRPEWRTRTLRRRAIENYLPFDVIDDYVAARAPNAREATTHLRALGASSEEFQHYHVKDGLVADLSDAPTKRLFRSDPQRSLSATDVAYLPGHWRSHGMDLLAALLRGFGDGLAEWATRKMRNGPWSRSFDPEAEAEAEEIFVDILRWV